MTAEELLNDINNCTGPCGELCLSCPESRYLKEIRDVIVRLLDENNRLRKTLMDQTGEVDLV